LAVKIPYEISVPHHWLNRSIRAMTIVVERSPSLGQNVSIYTYRFSVNENKFSLLLQKY